MIPEMTSAIYNEYVISKSSQTVKGLILEILGLFSWHFPACMNDKAGQMTHVLMENLHKQFKSNKPDMQLIAGSIVGLNYFLYHFQDTFMRGERGRWEGEKTD